MRFGGGGIRRRQLLVTVSCRACAVVGLCSGWIGTASGSPNGFDRSQVSLHAGAWSGRGAAWRGVAGRGGAEWAYRPIDSRRNSGGVTATVIVRICKRNRFLIFVFKTRDEVYVEGIARTGDLFSPCTYPCSWPPQQQQVFDRRFSMTTT